MVKVVYDGEGQKAVVRKWLSENYQGTEDPSEWHRSDGELPMKMLQELRLSPEQITAIISLAEEEDRDALLHLISTHAPEAYRWIHRCYHAPTLRSMRMQAVSEVGGWQNPYPLISERTGELLYEVMDPADSYIGTLVYSMKADVWMISSIGDLIEEHEIRGEALTTY